MTISVESYYYLAFLNFITIEGSTSASPTICGDANILLELSPLVRTWPQLGILRMESRSWRRSSRYSRRSLETSHRNEQHICQFAQEARPSPPYQEQPMGTPGQALIMRGDSVHVANIPISPCSFVLMGPVAVLLRILELIHRALIDETIMTKRCLSMPTVEAQT